MMLLSNVLAMLLLAKPAALPLPDHVDIPEGHSTVICPSVEAAKTMLTSYHKVQPAPNNHGIDITLFFQGLAKTGCAQDSPSRKGDVIAQSVEYRSMLRMANEVERYIVYRGVNKSDQSPLIGIVSEDSNNGYARTELAKWMSGRTNDGWLDARGNIDQIFYRCANAQQANAVVTAMKAQENALYKNFNAKLHKLAAQQKCQQASDRYYVTAIFSEANNHCGDECVVSLTALEAIDRSGEKVGLIYDASLI
jgi:hypothetical protein